MATYLNLMPIRYRRAQLIRRRVMQWMVVWFFAACCTIVVGWTQWSQYQAGAVKLASLRIRYEPIAAMEDEVEQLRKTIEQLQRRESLALSLADERSMLSLVGLLSEAQRACGGRISIGQLRLDRRGDRDTVTNTLTVTGVAVDDQIVAGFADCLRKADAFASVDLKSTGPTRVGEHDARAYTMECIF